MSAELEAREKLEKEAQAAADAKKAEEDKKKDEEAFKKRALEEAKEKAKEAAEESREGPDQVQGCRREEIQLSLPPLPNMAGTPSPPPPQPISSI